MERNPEDRLVLSKVFREAISKAVREKSAVAHINTELEDINEQARGDLKASVEVEDFDHIPTLSEMYVERRKWLRIKNVFAVSADLKNSTALNFDKYVNTSARLYEAATGSAVRIFGYFQ